MPRSIPTLLALAFLVACNGKDGTTDDGDTDSLDTTAPVVTLEGDDTITIAEGDDFEDPGATATDDVDGEVDVVVTDDLDEDVAGTYTITYTATDAAGNVGTAERTVIVEFEGELFLAGNGTSVTLIGLDKDGDFQERDTLELPLGEHSTNHQVFSITAHPTLSDTVYVTSANECSMWDVPGAACWGNARIDRLSYTVNGLSHEGAYLLQGPLRLKEPSYDASTGVTSFEIVHQGGPEVTINSLVPDLPTGEVIAALAPMPTYESNCDDVTLTEGDSCTFTTTDGDDTPADRFDIDLDTSLGDAWGIYDRDFNGTTLVAGIAFDDDVDGLPGCAVQGDDDDPFQVGECMPTAMTFSSDGTRAYVNDDEEDAFLHFSVDSDGELTFLDVGDGVDKQGVAVNDAHTAAYNGSCAYTISEDMTELQNGGDCEGGNATETVLDGDDEWLITTIDNTTLDIYDISTTPTAPVLVDSITPSKVSTQGNSPGRARFQDHSDDLKLFLTVDFTTINLYSFDGETLTEEDQLDIPVEITPCDGCTYRAQYRTVQMSADEGFAIAGGFANPEDEDTFNELPYMGWVRSFRIDSDPLQLDEADLLTLPGGVRTLLAVETP